jgi:PAS domain-containing protein
MQAADEDVAMLAVPDLFDVLDQLGDAVVILDREYRIVARNAAAERLGVRPRRSGTPGPRRPGEPSKRTCAGRCPNS